MKVIFTILLLVASSAIADQVEIREANLSVGPDQTQIIFELSKQPSTYRLFKLNAIKSKPRVVIDIKQARLANGFHRLRYQKGLIKKLRSGKRKGNVLRIVLDLTEKVKPYSYVTKSTAAGGYRLVVDLNSLKPQTARSKKGFARADVSRSLAETAVSRSAHEKIHKQRKPQRKIQPDAVRDVIVAIDPGHGGDDPGAIGNQGTREKDVVLKISKYLAKMINRQKGLQAILIRNGDYFVNLDKRLSIAREVKADMLISIHADAAHSASAQGISVYTLSKRGASSEAAKWLADRENRSDLFGGTTEMSAYKKDESLAKVLLDLSQTSTLQASGNIARFVLSELKKLGKIHRGGLGKAGFVVLKSPDIPSILIETGFISNLSEERKLRSGRYQKQVAQYILKGVMQYFMRHGPPNTHFAHRKSIMVNTGADRGIVAN